MDFIAENLIPLLPPDLQALYYHPPNLSSPGSLIPIIRIVFPYMKWVVVLLAAYIVWSFVIGIFGYFSRFLRFMTRIGPILGLVAWLMANSGQGSMDELFGLVKQWVGLDNAAGGGGQSPGIAALAGLFGGNNNNNNNQNSRSKGYSRSKAKTDPISSRTRAKKGKAAGAGEDSTADFISSLLNSAASNGGAQDGNLGNVVQDYVKESLAKAAGLDWLFGSGNGAAKKDEKKGWKTR
ncbi:hypothetical protein I317_03836 [Kwoniella heveanensis CBS 569]|nr:hypothetical protein I317_03836 [Kwoniella heveanensis CBS 569]